MNARDSDVDEKNKFPHLLDFLLDQKRVAEYVSSDLRGNSCMRQAVTHHLENANDHNRDWVEINRCLFHKSNNHKTEDCRDFLTLSNEERVKLLSEARACWSCLKPFHRSADCRYRKQCDIDGCRKYHHHLLHEADKAGIDFQGKHVMTTRVSNGGQSDASCGCLLQLMKISSHEGHVNVMWDSGATVSLITFAKAAHLKLEGKPLVMTVIKVGGVPETIHSSEYTVPLVNRNGETVEIKAYAIEKISTPVRKLLIPSVGRLFPGFKSGEIDRPHGEIDLLIGMEYAGFHPQPVQWAGHLVLMENQFGKCISGSHPTITDESCSLIQTVTIHHAKGIEISDFYDIESLGTNCQPRCGGCKCGKCSLGSNACTIKEDQEMKMINDGLNHDGSRWIADYPWIKDAAELPDNYYVALARLKSTEKWLKRSKELSELYDNQINDMFERNVARKLTDDEIRDYSGPVHYLPHHEVMKPDSQSTPCRIVFNSSAVFKGHVLNDYWAKGADLINSLLGVLLRFREENVPIIGDISKMYHAVGISEKDQHTHRFLWRSLDEQRKPDICVMTAVSFGDRPAGNIATAALRKSAESFSEIYPESVGMITRNAYVDDIIDSVHDEETANSRIAECNEILSHGSFKVKEWVTTSASRSDVQKEILAKSATGEAEHPGSPE